MLTFLVCCFLLVLCGEQKKVSGTVIASDKRVKVNVAQADIGSFYSQIQKVQLHKYDYVSDHFRRNRRFNGTQVGFIAQELKEVIPESVATVPTLKLRKGAYGTDETELNEFHVVDNDVVFTVNVGATQELIQRSESLETQLVVITKNYSDMATQLQLLDKHLNQEVSQQLIEKRKTAEAEVSKAELQIQLEKEQAAAKLKLDLAKLEAQAKEDRSMADKKAEIERKNADYADGLALKRLEKQNTDATQRQKVEHERARERNSELVKMQEEAQQRAEDARLAHGFKKQEVKILVVGLDNAGKTTLLTHLNPSKKGDVTEVVPTVGFTVENFVQNSLKFQAFDMSGQSKYRSLWEQYYNESQAIIWVIDSTDKIRVEVVIEELEEMLEHKHIAGRKIPILFFANKMDRPQAMSTINCVKKFELNSHSDFPWFICASNAVSGEGVEEGLEWLSNQLSGGGK